MLLDVTTALSAAHDTDTVVATIIDRLAASLGASTAHVGQVDEARGVIRTLGASGIPPEVVERFATYSVDAPFPSGEAVRTRSVVTVRDRLDRDRRFPALRGTEVPGHRSYAVVPLLVQDACIGVLSVGFDSEGAVGEGDRALLETLASQCAQALHRAALYEAEGLARRRAERLAERLALLQDVTARLSEARETNDVAEVITAYAAAGVGATCALLRCVDAPGTHLELVAARGIDEAHLESMSGPVPIERRTPVSDAVRELRPVVVSGREQRDELYPELAAAPFGNPATYVALPLVTDVRAVGALVLGWNVPHELPGAEIAFLLAMARQSAQALERAMLFEGEREARQAAERTAARLRLQQDLTAHLSGALDTKAVGEVILRYATTALGARGAVLHRVDDATRCFVLVAAHGTPVDPDYVSVPVDGDLPICDAVRSREPVLVAAAASAATAGGTAVASATGAATAFVVVPLVLDDRAVGALSVTWSAAVEYGTADAEFLAAVANQCARALARAGRYDEARAVARTLQGSLLPTRPPAIPGLEVAVRYRPISRRNEVGGDFYDVFRVAPGRWGVVIGDVSGKGVPAASLTALARYTVRAAAKREPAPSDVLRFLNETMLDAASGDERFCTVAYLELRLTPDGATARLAVGGHPLPVRRTAAGDVTAVGSPGMAVGLLPMANVEDVDVDLGAGDALVLYTDGVTEARSRSGAFAGELVEQVLAEAGSDDAETVADRIERATLDFQDGDPRDDLAVVVLRVPTDADAGWGVSRSTAVTLERDPASVAEARRVVREFAAEHGLDAVLDDVQLLTSEVVTNAILHAGTAVGLRLIAVADRLRVEASDGSGARPVRREANAEATNGRGLLLLDRVATSWDVVGTPDGKLVWFELALPSRPAPDG